MGTNRGLSIPVKLNVTVIDGTEVYLADFGITTNAELTEHQATLIATRLAHLFDVQIKHLVTKGNE